MVTAEIPSLVVERSSSIPDIVLTISSMGRVTEVSISSELAPRRVVVTTTTGKSTLGNRSTPSRKYEATPKTSGAARSMTVNTGLRIQRSQRFTWKPSVRFQRFLWACECEPLDPGAIGIGHW